MRVVSTRSLIVNLKIPGNEQCCICTAIFALNNILLPSEGSNAVHWNFIFSKILELDHTKIFSNNFFWKVEYFVCVRFSGKLILVSACCPTDYSGRTPEHLHVVMSKINNTLISKDSESYKRFAEGLSTVDMNFLLWPILLAHFKASSTMTCPSQLPHCFESSGLFGVPPQAAVYVCLHANLE